MINDLDKLQFFIESLIQNPSNKDQSLQVENEIIKPLADKLLIIRDQLCATYDATVDLANGDLDVEIKRDNLLGAALKDLQSSLRHLTWQVGRVADGDYSVKIDSFLGEFSSSFNRMVFLLSEREKALNENLRLNEYIAKQEIEMMEERYNQQVEKYEFLNQSVQEVRRYRHDMKNHLLALEAVLKTNNVEEALNYISTISEGFSKEIGSSHSLNYVLEALIDEKLNRLEQFNVKIEKRIVINRKLNLEVKDLCILLGNALDNAIEALEKVEEQNRLFTLILLLKGNVLSIKIENTMKEIKFSQEGSIVTSKQNKQNHGIGLFNIEKVVKRYQGEMSITHDHNKFCLLIALCGV